MKQQRRGYGSALLEGFQAVTNAPFVLTMDADLSHRPTFVRDLCNTPSLDMTPRQVAESALALADEEAKITVKALDENECKKLKMGSFLGVAKGSAEPKGNFEYLVEISS